MCFHHRCILFVDRNLLSLLGPDSALRPTIQEISPSKEFEMFALEVMSISLSLYLHSTFATACELKYSKEPLYGLQCVTTTTTSVWHTVQPQCVWRCLRQNTCRYINYNPDTNYCELGFDQCESLQPSAGVIVNAFGPPRQDCLHWGSRHEPGRVPVQTMRGFVARIIRNKDVLLGNLSVGSLQYWAHGWKSRKVGPVYETDPKLEILTKDAACPLPWMHYTAGEMLPFGIVTGGCLVDGSTTYVAKVIHNNDEVFGYYNPKSALAYYEFSGLHTTSEMDLLVLL